MSVWRDVRYAVRMLVRDRLVTVTAVAALALGIGVNTTVFTWTKAVMLRPLPGVTDPDRLVVTPGRSTKTGDYHTLSYPDYEDLRDGTDSLSGLVIWDNKNMTLAVGDHADRVYGSIVSGNYFDLLGVRMARGRGFLPEEDRTPDSHPVVVISHGLWQRSFGGDPRVLDSTIAINSHPFTVVGIAPPDFQGTIVGIAVDLWVPVMMEAQ